MTYDGPMTAATLEFIGTCIFALAVLHTFFVSYFQKIAKRFTEGSVAENLFHFLGEVEVVFGIWAAVFFTIYSFANGFKVLDEQAHLVGGALFYLNSLNFTEPVFVFVIMCIASTRPVIIFAERLIQVLSRGIPLPQKKSFFITTLILGPLLGSVITEPAAMTLTALILQDYFFSDSKLSEPFKYAIIGVLFVNISIGGTLTHFAAPPVLMVAGKWGWDIPYMMNHFGCKAIVAIILMTLVLSSVFNKQIIGDLKIKQKHNHQLSPSAWIVGVHLFFLALAVYTAHYPVFLLSVFLFFIGFVSVTHEYQDEVKFKESLMVAFFLAGLIVLGSMQKWWLQPLLAQLSDSTLFFGATILTAVTDNAALTYLGSLVELTESAKYYLVAGAVTGGGLTVIANAPNPAGYSLLRENFKDGVINPIYLFLAALGPTLVVILCFELIPALNIF